MITRTPFLGFIAFVLGIFLFIGNHVEAGDPDLLYRTIKTPHFDIHYQEPLEHTAQLAATIAEEVFDDLTILFQWQVKKTIEVVITDSTDSANGSAAVMGRPVVRLYATAPGLESTLSSHDHWLRTLIVHEFTHIIHLSIHGKTSDVINSVFGDVYLPNQMLPTAIVEGIAVLVETHQTSAGRIRSSMYQMYIRTAALEDALLDLAQVSHTTQTYLRGTHAYLYGAMFMEYIYQRYGMDKIIEFCHAYGKSVLPYGINRLFVDIFGEEIATLYKDWIDQAVEQSNAIREVLKQQGLTESVALTSDGETKGRPIFDLDGKHILLPIANGMQETGVYRVGLNGEKSNIPLFLSGSHATVTLDRNGRAYYKRSAPYKNLYHYRDLFSVERGSRSPRRLTYGLRVLYSAVSPRGDQVAVVVNQAGTTHLKITNENGNILKTLIQSKTDDQVYDPTWSPDGAYIAAPIRRGPKIDLAIIDAETGETRFITDDRFLEMSPTFDPTGRYLLYGSDRSGIFNIYAYDLETSRLLQITNVVTGAFYPAVSPDQRTLAFLKYSSRGYDLHTMPLHLEDAPLAKAARPSPPKAPPIPKPATLHSKRYNPLPVMIPSHWLLNAEFDVDWNTTLQAVTAFSDLTGRNSAGVELTYDIERQNVSGRLAYGYSGLNTGVRIGFSRSYAPQTEGYVFEGENEKWTQIVTRGSLGLSFGFLGVDTNHHVSLTYNIVHSRPRENLKLTLNPQGELPDIPESYFRVGMDVGWSYSDLISSPMGVGSHRGRAMSASLSLNHPTIGGTQNLTTFRYSWTEALPVPWPISWLKHHTVSLRLSGGVHLSDPPDRWSFSVGGYTPRNVLDTILNNTSAGSATLRGYPPDSFKGSHFHSLKFSYRFPIWYAELGYGTVPFFLRRVQGSFFSDNVLISYDELNRDDWKSSIGGAVSILFTLGYYQYMSLKFVAARGLMKGGGNEILVLLSGGG